MCQSHYEVAIVVLFILYLSKGGPGKETLMYNSQHTTKFEFSRPQLRVRPWGRQSSGVKPKLANLVTVPSFLRACIYSMNYVALEFQDRDTQQYITAPTKKLASQCGKSCQTLQPAGSKYLDFANSEDCLFFKKFRPYCTKNCHNVKVHFRFNPNKFRLTDIAKIIWFYAMI